MTTTTVQVNGLDEVIASLGGMDDRTRRAVSRALNGTIKWASTQVARDVAKEHDIPVRAVKGYRVFTDRATKRNLSGQVWIGIAPVKSGYIGKGRNVPSRGGARVRSHFFQGGFVAKMKSGHEGIFKRVGAARLPIREERVELGAPRDYAWLEPKIAAEYDKRLTKELNYELNVKSGN